MHAVNLLAVVGDPSYVLGFPVWGGLLDTGDDQAA
jgi:hypothetical protein